jgi:hypothetical protein
MKNLIEETERQQLKYWKGFLIAWFLALTLLIIRHLFGTVFKQYELNSRPIGIVVLTVTVILVLTIFVFVVKLNLLRGRAKSDPQLKEALIDNELSKLYILQSWKVGFIGAVATPFAFLFISSFHPINDLLLVALSTCAIGSGAFLTSFYLKSSK